MYKCTCYVAHPPPAPNKCSGRGKGGDLTPGLPGDGRHAVRGVLNGRSQDTPFFQHMMPKNQLMKLSLLPSAVGKGGTCGAAHRGESDVQEVVNVEE